MTYSDKKCDEKRAITQSWVIRFTSKLQGRWILLCWSFLPHVRFLFLLTIFELLPKNCNFSIYRHGGHDGWSAGSSDISFKGNPLRMIQAKFGLNWPSGFRGEDFFKSLQTDDGRQVIAIAHLTLWVRWAKNRSIRNKNCLWRPCLLIDRDKMSNL